MTTEREPTKEILDTSKEEDQAKDEFEAILKDLPKENNNKLFLYHYQGCWIPKFFLSGLISAQKNFVARDNDILLVCFPKSGTTWLKSLTFSIAYRNQFSLADSPLLKANPHDVVPYIEDYCLKEYKPPNSEAPRLLGSHIPYRLLPPSIKTSRCKIVYLFRNIMDQFTSYWHFLDNFNDEGAELDGLEECFDKFCHGRHLFGPFWEHVLGFCEASVEMPERILFLKYEDLKKDPLTTIKKLAEFLGFGFSEEEQKQGLIEDILAFCSIDRMKNLEVNKNGKRVTGTPRNAFFRKGEVGDSKNLLTSAMIQRMEKLMQEKYGENSLAFKLSL